MGFWCFMVCGVLALFVSFVGGFVGFWFCVSGFFLLGGWLAGVVFFLGFPVHLDFGGFIKTLNPFMHFTEFLPCMGRSYG